MGRVLLSVFLGLVLALFAACVHFLLVEGSYQLAVWTGLRQAEVFSEKVAWPAPIFYQQAHLRLLRRGLRSIGTDTAATAAERSQARHLDLALSEDHTWREDDLQAATALLEAKGWPTTLPWQEEVWIYGGVSAGWGSVVGLLGGCLFYFLRSLRTRRRLAAASALPAEDFSEWASR